MRANRGDPPALALLREIENDTRAAARLVEMSRIMQTPATSKMCHYTMLALTLRGRVARVEVLGQWDAVRVALRDRGTCIVDVACERKAQEQPRL